MKRERNRAKRRLQKKLQKHKIQSTTDLPTESVSMPLAVAPLAVAPLAVAPLAVETLSCLQETSAPPPTPTTLSVDSSQIISEPDENTPPQSWGRYLLSFLF